MARAADVAASPGASGTTTLIDPAGNGGAGGRRLADNCDGENKAPCDALHGQDPPLRFAESRTETASVTASGASLRSCSRALDLEAWESGATTPN